MLTSVLWRAVVVIAVFVAAWVAAQNWVPAYVAVPLALVAAAVVEWGGADVRSASS